MPTMSFTDLTKHYGPVKALDGFTVDIGENLTGDAMRRAFDRLYGKIKPGTVALIFYSGFGVQSGRQSYLIPVDA